MLNPEKRHEVRPRADRKKLHFIAGGGGLKSILAGTGSYVAIHHAGTVELISFGGASGGSIVTAFMASQKTPRAILHMGIETDYTTLITARGWPRRTMGSFMADDRVYGWYAVAAVWKRFRNFVRSITPKWMRTMWRNTIGRTVNLVVRPKEGVYGTDKLVAFIDKQVGEFPENFWCVAVDGDSSSQVLFTKKDVVEYHPDGHKETLSEGLPGCGLPVQASIAVPWFFGAVKFQDKLLLDGSLTMDGRTPIEAVKRHFGANPGDIIALDMWDSVSSMNWFESLFWKTIWGLFCGGTCPQSGRFPSSFEGVILIQPQVDSRITLQFAVTADEKWPAIMAGFAATSKVLEQQGLLTGEKLAEANAIVAGFAEIKRTSKAKGELSTRTQELLTQYRLW